MRETAVHSMPGRSVCWIYAVADEPSRLSGEPLERRQNPGFTLLEVLIAMTILTILAVALAHSLGMIYQFHSRAGRYSGETIQLWNEAETFRLSPQPEEEGIQILPQARPLRRRILQSSSEPSLGWEVLSAQK